MINSNKNLGSDYFESKNDLNCQQLHSNEGIKPYAAAVAMSHESTESHHI